MEISEIRYVDFLSDKVGCGIYGAKGVDKYFYVKYLGELYEVCFFSEGKSLPYPHIDTDLYILEHIREYIENDIPEGIEIYRRFTQEPLRDANNKIIGDAEGKVHKQPRNYRLLIKNQADFEAARRIVSRIASEILIGNLQTRVFKDEFFKELNNYNITSIDIGFAEEIDTYVAQRNIEGKERTMIIRARVNQGAYRDLLLQKYKKCCICGVEANNLLVASHIKPWREATAEERVDVNNGLLLCPNHDKLFDQGLISFDDFGKIIISSRLSLNDRMFMNVADYMKITIDDKMCKYMEYHRQNIFE